jgi:hypothetical protein
VWVTVTAVAAAAGRWRAAVRSPGLAGAADPVEAAAANGSAGASDDAFDVVLTFVESWAVPGRCRDGLGAAVAGGTHEPAPATAMPSEKRAAGHP